MRRLGVTGARTVGFAALVSALVLVVGVNSGGAAGGLPSSIAALGASIANGFGAGGPSGSFITGTDSGLSSHLQRLQGLGDALTAANVSNAAVPGLKMGDVAGQVPGATNGHDYTVIMSGTNDVCGPTTPADMTSASTFQSQVSSALTALNGSSRVLLVSIPNWKAL